MRKNIAFAIDAAGLFHRHLLDRFACMTQPKAKRM